MQNLKAGLIGVVVLLSPIPVGGYKAWLLPVILVLTGIALLIELMRMPPSPARKGSSWLIFWFAVVGYGTLQSVVFYLTRDVSFYVPSAGTGLEYSVIDVGRVVEFMLRFTVYLALAFVVSRMPHRELNILVLAIIFSALFQSLYGLINFARGNPSILGIWPAGMHGDSVMGTFYSRNQLAGYLAMALPVGLAWLWRQYTHARPGAGSRSLLPGLAILFAMLLSVALVGSGSRLGLTAAVAGILFWAWRAQTDNSNTVSAQTTRVLLWFIAAVVLLAILWFGPDVIVARFLQLSRADARFTIWGTMLAMPFGVWLWGIGPGQFIDVFKLYQSADLSGTYWRALNDHLQFTLEYGLIGTLLMALMLTWWLRRVWPKKPGGLQTAALAGVVAVLFHSLGDFDLRVPGTAVLFWVALGIAVRR